MGQLPGNWQSNQTVTQQIGDDWLDGVGGCLLRVPSVIVPIAESDDRNILIQSPARGDGTHRRFLHSNLHV